MAGTKWVRHVRAFKREHPQLSHNRAQTLASHTYCSAAKTRSAKTRSAKTRSAKTRSVGRAQYRSSIEAVKIEVGDFLTIRRESGKGTYKAEVVKINEESGLPVPVIGGTVEGQSEIQTRLINKVVDKDGNVKYDDMEEMRKRLTK